MKWLASVSGLCLMACAPSTPDRLVAADGISADRIPVALTDQVGDVGRGQSIFSDRDKGHCVLCHQVAGLDTPFQGDVGPELSHVGDRLDAAQLRLRIVDYQLVLPGALMPSYYRIHDLYQVQERYAGSPILSAQQVEDLVAYLGDLKGGADDLE